MRIFNVPQGMAKSIFENKYARKKGDGTYQNWEERLLEVVDGNFSLTPDEINSDDYYRTQELALAGVMPFSGRHLQHGDASQAKKEGEKFTNCSTAAFSFLKFWLLLKGSGVGRCYDADVCRVNWDNMPEVRLVLTAPDTVNGVEGHPDYEDWIESAQTARHKYDSESEDVRWFTVADSAEGWVKVVEILETAAFQEKHRHKLFIFDFSGVRQRGTPIMGQQGRPASGPVPFIKALNKVIGIRGAGMRSWKQALFIDDYLSACVSLGGIRRSSRIAVKNWRERDVFDFIDIKRGGWLRTANNSVGVDAEFWHKALTPAPSHARRVFEAMCSASYFDKTGEPAFLNLDRLTWQNDGIDQINASSYLNSAIDCLNTHPKTREMIDKTLECIKKKNYPYIVNPCGEIVLSMYGGYCIVGDVCLANAETLVEAIDAVRLMAKALIRVNKMEFLYDSEVKRTNRIGVGITGIFEFAWTIFGYNFFDLLDETHSSDFWEFVATMREEAMRAAESYAHELGMVPPHTALTMKPSGTISKVMGCTEAAHLPAFAYFMRWVQYHEDDPAIKDHTDRGYPVKDISSKYPEHVVIGFPTKMPIADLMGERVVTMSDVTPDDQYAWLTLLEKHWLGENQNNQISYTLKYDPQKVNYLAYMDTILRNQRSVKACAIMPQVEKSAYIYLPEEEITREAYSMLIHNIERFANETYDEDLLCPNGHCPIEPNINGNGHDHGVLL